jgi:hypothetical protein
MNEIKKVSNCNARQSVQSREEFDGANTFARMVAVSDVEAYYAVYSYGQHFPLFAYSYILGEWFGNTDHYFTGGNKYSRTTSKHRSQLHPSTPMHKVGTRFIKTMLTDGLVTATVNGVR